MKDHCQEQEERSFSFTLQGRRKLSETADRLGEKGSNDPLLFQTIRDEVRTIPFGDYLKRYIYLNSGMSGSYREIPSEEYRQTIMDAFRDNGVPASMKDREVRLATVAGRWLEQYRTGRETVLLLGFGLKMQAEEVDDFLMNALHDHRLDPEDPLEGICRYCYQHQYGFDKMRRLREAYEAGLAASEGEKPEPAENRLQSERTYRQDRQLLEELFRRGGDTEMKRKTRERFREMYQKAARKMVLESSGVLGANASPADFERVFCPPVFRDRYGNLKIKICREVQRELSSKRFTRQHLHLLLSGRKEPDRYDLLTLGFYLHTGTGGAADAESRIMEFETEMNRTLDECGYGPIYTADPYECYLLMSLASAEPMETYNNVMEMAMEEQEGSF